MLWLVTLGFLGEILVPMVLAWNMDGYSHFKNVISELGMGTSPVRSLMNSWLILFGLMLTKTRPYMIQMGLPSVTVSLLTFYGITCIIDGVFPMSVSEEETVESKIHGIFGGLGFLALTCVPISMYLYGLGNSGISMVFSVLSVASLVLFIASEKRDGVIGLSGFWQRVYLAVNYVYLSIVFYTHS